MLRLPFLRRRFRMRRETGAKGGAERGRGPCGTGFLLAIAGVTPFFFSVCATSVATFHPFVTLPLLSEPVIVMWGRLMGR